MAKQLKAAILARRAAKAPRKKRTRPKPRQYTIADWESARDRVAAAERRIDNDRTNNPNWGRAGLERAQLEVSTALRFARCGRIKCYLVAARRPTSNNPRHQQHECLHCPSLPRLKDCPRPSMMASMPGRRPGARLALRQERRGTWLRAFV